MTKIDWPRRVWEKSRCKGTAKLILFHFAFTCDDNGVRYTTLVDIQKEMNLANSSLHKAIEQLLHYDELQYEEGKGRRVRKFKINLGE